MPTLVQLFNNTTNHPQFLKFKPSTARYRLNPGCELILRYEDEQKIRKHRSSLEIDSIEVYVHIEYVVWTNNEKVFDLSGQPMEQCFDPN